MPRTVEEWEVTCSHCCCKVHVPCAGPAVCTRCGAKLAIEWRPPADSQAKAAADA